MEEIVLNIIENLKNNNVTNHDWNRIKRFIDFQYEEEKEKTTINTSNDSLINQIRFGNF